MQGAPVSPPTPLHSKGGEKGDLDASNKLERELKQLRARCQELEHENTKLRKESRSSQEEITRLKGELLAGARSSADSTKSGAARDRRQAREHHAPFRDYKNLEAMYERVYGKSQK